MRPGEIHPSHGAVKVSTGVWRRNKRAVALTNLKMGTYKLKNNDSYELVAA